MNRYASSFLVLIFLLPTVLGAVEDSCRRPDSVSILDQITRFCPGTFILLKPIEIHDTNLNLTCDQTILVGDYGSTAFLIRNSSLSLTGCTFQQFQYALTLEQSSTVVFADGNSIQDSVAGIRREQGSIARGTVALRNVTRKEVVVLAPPSSGSLDVSEPATTNTSQVRSFVLFPTTVTAQLQAAEGLGIDTMYARTATNWFTVQERRANVEGSIIQVEEHLMATTDVPQANVYIVVGNGFTVVDAPKTISATRNEQVTVRYTILGNAEALTENPPILLIGREQSPVENLGTSKLFWWIVFFGITGVIVFLNRKTFWG